MKRKRKSVPLGAILLFLGAWPAAGQVYVFLDEQGVVHFTNAPTHQGFQLHFPEDLSKRPGPTKERYEALIRAAAQEHQLDPALVSALIEIESNFDPLAVSRKGAKGLMQLMPKTAWELAIFDAFDPKANIEGGTRHLRRLLDLFDGNLTLALAAYNAGENAVLRYGGVPPYRETKEYVSKVLSLYKKAPPQKTPSSRTKKGEDLPHETSNRIYRYIDESGSVRYTNLPPPKTVIRPR